MLSKPDKHDLLKLLGTGFLHSYKNTSTKPQSTVYNTQERISFPLLTFKS